MPNQDPDPATHPHAYPEPSPVIGPSPFHLDSVRRTTAPAKRTRQFKPKNKLGSVRVITQQMPQVSQYNQAQDNRPLPGEWVQATDPSTDRPYWYHMNSTEDNHITTWDNPYANLNENDCWQVATTDNGQQYWYNTMTNETSWTRPAAVTEGDAAGGQPREPTGTHTKIP